MNCPKCNSEEVSEEGVGVNFMMPAYDEEGKLTHKIITRRTKKCEKCGYRWGNGCITCGKVSKDWMKK